MKKGFTLIELLAVIVIVAIISLIAIPQIAKLVDNIRLKADLESVRGYVTAAENYYMKAQYNQSLYDTLGTNVIDKLSIKGDRLEGSVIVTTSGKVELALIKNKKCYKKSSTSNNIDVMEQALCNVNAKRYASNNGKLSVSGTKILNERGEEFRLQGASLETDLMSENSKTYYSKKALKNLKNWGANVLRLFVGAKNEYLGHYIDNEDEYIKYVFTAIDNAIANDLYVIVNWCPGDSTPYTDGAVDLFRRVAIKYKNDPHILYEIWNEANDSNVTWDVIKQHANRVIPAIRSISPDAIVLCVKSTLDKEYESLKNDPLPYHNVMYVYHNYTDGMTDTSVMRLVNAIKSGVPMFVTEWASTPSGSPTGDVIQEAYGTEFAKVLKRYNISYTYFCFSAGQWSYAFVNKDKHKWDEDLPDSILSNNAKMFKKILRDDISDNYHVLKSNSAGEGQGKYYRSKEWKNKIVSIEFKNKLSVPDSAVITWDLSFSEDESVIGYLTKTDVEDRYNMVICANGIINAPIYSGNLFAELTNLKSIKFNNFVTNDVPHMNGMFMNDTSLEQLDLSGFDSSKVSNMSMMFYNCQKLKSINFNGWNAKVDGISYAFYNCKNLKVINLSGIDVTKTVNFEGLFSNCTSLEKVNISTWNPKKVSNFKSTFSNCTKLNNVDMGLFDFQSTSNLTNALYNVPITAHFIVKNSDVVDLLNAASTNAISYEFKVKDDSGRSKDISWEFISSTSTLNIIGNGEMADYTESSLAPWYKYRDYIKNIYVSENVTKLGNYAFYGLENVVNIKIDAIALTSFQKSSSDPNIGDNYIMYKVGNKYGATLTFGPNVTKIPFMFLMPAGYATNKKITNVIFEGDKITTIGNYGLAYLNASSLVINEGLKTCNALSFAYGQMNLIILPNSLHDIANWSLQGNKKLEKLVFGPSIDSIKINTISDDENLREVVIPHIDKPEVAYAQTFAKTKDHTVTIYGDSSTEQFVNNTKNVSGQTNLVYKNINEYKSSITSNINITASVNYNDSYTFTSSQNIKVYYKYITSSGKTVLSSPLSVTKEGNTYTISNIKSDIYIEAK